MFKAFFAYFLKYIFMAKTRQGLLIMAMSGLVISSFSLLTIQSTLQGLQGNRIERSKAVKGSYTLYGVFKSSDKIFEVLDSNGVKYQNEYEAEGMLQNRGYVIPVIFHGVDTDNFVAEFLPGDLGREEILLSSFMSSKAHMGLDDQAQIYSPAFSDAFFGDLPRTKIVKFTRFVDTREPELEEYHAWTHIKNIQSLARKRSFNKIRIYQQLDDQLLSNISSFDLSLKSWEQENSTLVYALSLENNIMLFLFMGTVVLVILSIISGLSIFYNRVKGDFASFWIMGMSLKQIKKLGVMNIGVITGLAVVLGNGLALLFLQVLQKYSPVIMPAMFVDRSLPVKITGGSFIYSFIIPVLITIIFSTWYNRRFFKNKDDFIQLIRSVGR